jgi:hypothetical protein
MKQIIYFGFLFAFLLSFNFGQAQNKQETKDKILEHKLRFFKERLMLNQQESNAFEKVYKTYDKQKTILNQRFRKDVIGKIKNGKLNNLNEKEQMNVINTKLAIDKKKFDLENKLVKDLLEIIPPVKVIMYYKLERQFNRKLIKKLRERRKHP